MLSKNIVFIYVSIIYLSISVIVKNQFTTFNKYKNIILIK